MNNKVLDRIHICLCPIILGGGRPSFIQEKYVRLNKLKSFDPNHYKMGEDVLFDIKFLEKFLLMRKYMPGSEHIRLVSP